LGITKGMCDAQSGGLYGSISRKEAAAGAVAARAFDCRPPIPLNVGWLLRWSRCAALLVLRCGNVLRRETPLLLRGAW
jgi:hypothetical protein